MTDRSLVPLPLAAVLVVAFVLVSHPASGQMTKVLGDAAMSQEPRSDPPASALPRSAYPPGDSGRAVGIERRTGARAPAPGTRLSSCRARGGDRRRQGAHRRCAARRVGHRARPGVGGGDSGHADDPRRGGRDVRHVRVTARRRESLATRRHPRSLAPCRSRGGVRCPKAHPAGRSAPRRVAGLESVVANRGHHRALPHPGRPALARLRRRRPCRRHHRQPSRPSGQLGGPVPGRLGGLDLVRGDGCALRAVAHTPEPAALHRRRPDRLVPHPTHRPHFRMVGLRGGVVSTRLRVRLALRPREPRVLDFGRLPRPHGAHHLAGPRRHHRDGVRTRRRRPGLEPLCGALADDRDRARRAPVARRRALRRDREPGEPFDRGAQPLARGAARPAPVRAHDPCAGRSDLARRSGRGAVPSRRACADSARTHAMREDRHGRAARPRPRTGLGSRSARSGFAGGRGAARRRPARDLPHRNRRVRVLGAAANHGRSADRHRAGQRLASAARARSRPTGKADRVAPGSARSCRSSAAPVR